jgi:anti-anti-sigma regulatory factor
MVVSMAMIAEWLRIDEERFVPALQEAGQKLNGGGGEVVLDFSCVFRIGPSALRAMESFAKIADDKAVKVVLRDVNVNVYKVLKLVKLAPRFSFVTRDPRSPD